MCDTNKNILEMVQSAPHDKYTYSYLKNGNWKEDTISDWTFYLNKDRAVLFFSEDTDCSIELILEMVFNAKKGLKYVLLYEHNWKKGYSFGLDDKNHIIHLDKDSISEQVERILNVGYSDYHEIAGAISNAVENIITYRKIKADLNATLHDGIEDIFYIMEIVRRKMIDNPLDPRIARIELDNAGTHFCIVGSCGKTPSNNFNSFIGECGFEMEIPSIKRLACKEQLIRTSADEDTAQRTIGALQRLKTHCTNPELSSAKIYDIVFSEAEQKAFNDSLKKHTSTEKTGA